MKKLKKVENFLFIFIYILTKNIAYPNHTL
jgi:hypothetical protein